MKTYHLTIVEHVIEGEEDGQYLTRLVPVFESPVYTGVIPRRHDRLLIKGRQVEVFNRVVDIESDTITLEVC